MQWAEGCDVSGVGRAGTSSRCLGVITITVPLDEMNGVWLMTLPPSEAISKLDRSNQSQDHSIPSTGIHQERHHPEVVVSLVSKVDARNGKLRV